MNNSGDRDTSGERTAEHLGHSLHRRIGAATWAGFVPIPFSFWHLLPVYCGMPTAHKSLFCCDQRCFFLCFRRLFVQHRVGLRGAFRRFQIGGWSQCRTTAIRSASRSKKAPKKPAGTAPNRRILEMVNAHGRGFLGIGSDGHGISVPPATRSAHHRNRRASLIGKRFRPSDPVKDGRGVS